MLCLVFWPATGERKGMFVTAMGDRTAGLTSADGYTRPDPSIPEHLILSSINAAWGIWRLYARRPRQRSIADWDGSTRKGEAALLESARTFSNNCAAEMGNPEILPYLEPSKPWKIWMLSDSHWR